MNKCVGAIFFSVVAFATLPPAYAQSVEQVTTADIRISSDLAVDATYFEAIPRVEAAVRGVAQRRWLVPGDQQVEVIEAFTRKSDGRIIPAGPTDFSTQNGILGDAASFVDGIIKIQQVAFRDLSVGDTTVLTLRTTERDHYIPGQYGQELFIVPGGAKQTLEVTLRTPQRRTAVRVPGDAGGRRRRAPLVWRLATNATRGEQGGKRRIGDSKSAHNCQLRGDREGLLGGR
jgi:hypothetical protein